MAGAKNIGISGQGRAFSGRIEDRRLLTGRGRYIADLSVEQCLTAEFVRAEIACGTIRHLDCDGAIAGPGVLDVITAETLSVAGVCDVASAPLPRDDARPPLAVDMPLLCRDRVRHLGEPLALVLAETQAQARDAAEEVVAEIDATGHTREIAFYRRFNEPTCVEAALSAAAHRVSVSVDLPRITAMPMECRGCLAVPQEDGSLILYTSSQNPFAVKRELLAHFGWHKDSLRVVAPDVGGSFGLKGFMTREEALVCWAARRHGRPVRWISSRSDAFLADHQSRAVTAKLTLGLSEDLRFVALEATFEVDIGGYPNRRAAGMIGNLPGITGVYDIRDVFAEVTGWTSCRAPLAPYRGNGRPEATHAIEALIDAAARRLSVDPVDLRRRNLVTPDALPLQTALGFPLDCGDFPKVLDHALDVGDYAGVEGRRAQARSRGKLHGFGLVTCIESAGGPVVAPRPDHARIVVTEDGRVRLATGVMSVGQGHETAMSRMARDVLGIDAGRIDYVNGDTAAVIDGRGSGGSAGLTVAGTALHLALGQVIEEGRAATAKRFGCAAADVAYYAGTFSVTGTNSTLTLEEIAQETGGATGWTIETTFKPEAATFPNGVHLCEVEIDRETGQMQVIRYSAVEDVGTVMNPDLVAGQLHGGICMGLSQARGEAMYYDGADQILTGSLMDYYVVRASDVPGFVLDTVEVPTRLNPLGVKGVGEAGTVGATAALMSAVGDALAQAGVTCFEMPATPFRIWQALQAAPAQ